MKVFKSFFFIVILIRAGLVYSQEQAAVKPLFKSDDLLELMISMNVDEVINDLDIRDEHEATLSYKLPDGQDQTLKIKVVVRGKTRANPEVCKFPPLKLNFKKKKVVNTLFAGQNKLKLVTHCNSRVINEEYITREYHVYKLYQLVTDYSLKVRLCKIIYEDVGGNYAPASHYGFILEDIDALARRNGMEEYKDSIANQEVCRRLELDRLMLFQYMIGNLDWSIPNRHNFKLIGESQQSFPVAVPYDFDYAGIVNTSYAIVPEDIDVANVRVRVFRGLCRQQGGYDIAIKYFQDIKPSVYALYSESPSLSARYIKNTLKYIDRFYKILDNPNMLEQNITKVCRASHQHLFEN